MHKTTGATLPERDGNLAAVADHGRPLGADLYGFSGTCMRRSRARPTRGKTRVDGDRDALRRSARAMPRRHLDEVLDGRRPGRVIDFGSGDPGALLSPEPPSGHIPW